jgi:hypothetical protein
MVSLRASACGWRSQGKRPRGVGNQGPAGMKIMRGLVREYKGRRGRKRMVMTVAWTAAR